MIKLETKNYNMILTEKQQKYKHYHMEKYEYIKYDKYEYVTGEEILPPHQKRIMNQAKFIYSSLGKALDKQTKTIEGQ